MAGEIPSPADPPPPAPGQPASPVAAIVPGQFSGNTPAVAGIGMVPGLGAGDYSGDFTKNYFTDLYKRMGLSRYEPSPAGYERARQLPELKDMFADAAPYSPGQGFGMEGPRISGPGDLDFWLRPYSQGMKGASFQRSVREGFDDSLIGSMFAWQQMRQQVGDVVEPNYDPFRDDQIAKAGMTSMMSLFYGSQGREHTRWLIDHIREKQRETEWASHGSVAEEIGAFIGGILGDPSTLLPGNLGMKAIGMAGRAGRLGASTLELRMMAAGRAAYGSIGDGLRMSGLQAGVMIAERALKNQLDPTIPGDVSADVVIPSVIAGSLGMLQGVSARYTANRLADQVAQRDFLKPTPAAPPEPRKSFLGSQVVDTVLQKTRPAREFVEKIPEPLREKAKDEAKDLVKEELVGPPSNNGNFPPGALATSYGPTRVHEHKTSASAAGFTEMVESSRYGQLASETKLLDADQHPIPFYHGTRNVFSEFDPARSGGRFGTSAEGGLFHFISDPATASQYAEARALSETPGSEAIGAPNVHKVYLNMRNPIDITQLLSQEIQAHPDFVMPKGLDDEAAHANVLRIKNEIMPDIVAFAKAQGHDGMIAQTATNQGYEAIAFDKNQIVSMGERYEPKKVSPITENNHWLDERGKPIVVDESKSAPVTSEGAHQPGSVGAQLSPESLAYQESVLREQGRLMPTGIGFEKMPLNPMMRAFQGASVNAMRFAADVASTGGLITKANAEGIANLPPVETMFQVNWNKRLVDVLRYQQDQWSAYRQKVAGSADIQPENVSIESRPDWKRVGEQLGTAIKDKVVPGERGLSYEQFRIRVAEAQNKGDVDAAGDAASPYINAAASKFRSDIYEHTKARALETGVFDEVYRDALDQAHSDVAAIEREAKDVARRSKLEKWDPDRTRQAEEALMARQEDAEFKYQQQKKQLDNLHDNGPMLNGTAQSYRPRLWDTGALIDNEQAFFDKVVPWFQTKAGGSLDVTEAVRITKQIHELLSHQNPIFERGDMKALFQGVAGPTSAHARSFTIPDELVKDFLVNDSETLARYHVQQMGKAIEFKERFGSLDAKEQIAEIEQDYRRQIIAANEGATEATPLAKQLAAQMKTGIEDAQALRDKFYGTYGASPDPHRWDSRTIRMAKQFNNLTMLGMSGISALGDLMRPVMTEGIDAVYGYGIRSLMSESRALIMKMNKAELELEGNGMELQLNVRAMAAADTGDMFGSRGRFEHGMNQANAWMFVANGLNAVNQIDKEWARLSVGGRVNNILLDLAAEDRGGGALRLSELDRGRFAAAGIDEVTGRRIGLQIKIHGRDFGNITMPNTTAWTDDYARDVYRSAMNQFVNRTVPTPGIGDRPNWASTEWGGLISQYKSFGMGSLIRGGISGLQEGGNRFWYGAASAVGFAILLNEIRSQLFYDKSTFDKPAPAVIVDGIDRSGILGWFSDVNRAVETLSGHRIGVKPMLGAEKPVTPTLPQVAGTLAGPTASQAARVVSVANDYMSGHPTATTMRNWRALTPGGNLPYAGPAMDAVYGSGDYPSQSRARAP